jgi:hypothetical protein
LDKETYVLGKRDLITRKKRPTNMEEALQVLIKLSAVD